MGCISNTTRLLRPLYQPSESLTFFVFWTRFSLVIARQYPFYPRLGGQSDALLVVFNRYPFVRLDTFDGCFWRQFLEKY